MKWLVLITAIFCHGVLSKPLFVFGDEQGETALSPCDDCCSVPLSFPNSFPFMNLSLSGGRISSNGLLILSGEENDCITTYTPFPFPSTTVPVITAFWADIDLRDSGEAWIGVQSGASPVDTELDFESTFWIQATWHNVGCKDSVKENNFQVVAATDGISSRACFVYPNAEELGNIAGGIEWTTGSANGGIDGLGGQPAQAGFDGGNFKSYYSLPESLSDAIRSIDGSSDGASALSVGNGFYCFDTTHEEIIPICLPGSFIHSGMNACAACPDSCDTCDAFECFSCSSGFYLNLSSCEMCDSNCETCEGTANFCTSCEPGFLDSANVCVTICPDGQYENEITDQCELCDPNCELCEGTADFCTSCESGFLDSGNMCVSTCPVGEFGNSLNGECDLCEPNCETCQGAAELCTSCEIGFLDSENVCVTTCPDGEFGNPGNERCESCDENCATCEGTANFCTSCHDAFNLDVNTCLPCNCLDCPIAEIENPSELGMCVNFIEAPGASQRWRIYRPCCVRWNPEFATESTATITLEYGNGFTGTFLIGSNVAIPNGQFQFTLHGVLPGLARVLMTFQSGLIIYSEQFVILVPGTSGNNEC